MSDSTPGPTDEQQITITRVFDAPRELVFKAWTYPDEWPSGSGRRVSTAPRDSVEIDLRVCGRFNLRIVQGGSGLEYRLR